MRNTLIPLTITVSLFALAACGSARQVQRTQTGGTVALEGDRDKAMEKADEMMSSHCAGPYTIVEEGEVVVGSETSASEETDATEDGTLLSQGGSSTRDATEWRVTYECGQGGGAAPEASPAAEPEPTSAAPTTGAGAPTR